MVLNLVRYFYIKWQMINNIGLVLNIIGTLLVAFAFGKLPDGDGGETANDKGKDYHFVYLIHPVGFYIGVLSIIVGFFLQLKY